LAADCLAFPGNDAFSDALKIRAQSKEDPMKKILIALTAASALAVGTMAVPQKAEAYAWWVVPSIILGTAVVGGAVIAGSHAAYANQHYAPRGSVRVAPTRGCYLQEQPALFGGYRYVEVCR
jgi:hypothetical protein